MKTKIILALILTLAFGAIFAVEAQTRQQQQKVQIHKQKRFSRSNLTVKFVSLVEDSRCPIGTNCIWAGNAKIKIEVSKGRSKKTFEVNTNVGPKGATYDGYQIELIDLKPVPANNVRINKNGYIATFAVSRLTR